MPSITERSEGINQYLKNVNISPFDLTKKQLDKWAETEFNPSKLEVPDLETVKMKKAVVKAIEHIASVSKTNLVRNADGILCRKSSDSEAEWANDVKRMIPEKSKLSY